MALRYLLVLLVLTFLGAGCTDPPTPPNTLTQETLSIYPTTMTGLSGTGSFIDLTQAVTYTFNFSIPYSGTYSVYSNDTFEFQLDFTQATPACPCTFSYNVGPASGPVISQTASYLSPQIQL
jgi:hypothetical protein